MDARDTSSRRYVGQRSARPNRQTIPIRNANHTTPPAHQPTPPSQAERSHGGRINYPLPIAKELQERALELYIKYLDAELKQKLEKSHNLTVPGRGDQSVVSSQFTESVVSFGDEDEEPTSPANGNGKTEGETAFDGKKVIQRKRKPLSPTARAKAALIRHLVSCYVCKERRVKCSLDHHDIACLEELRAQRDAAPRPKLNNVSASSASGSSQQTATSLHADSFGPGPSISQSQSLMGIGGDMNATPDIYTSHLDVQSPGGMAYDEITLDTPLSGSLVVADRRAGELEFTAYSSYREGQMLVLGAQRRGYFSCQYQHLSDGLCLEVCPTIEDLYAHFHSAHFAFQRIDDPYRNVCESCCSFNDSIVGLCAGCRVGQIQVLVHGSFISREIQVQSPNIDMNFVDFTFQRQGHEAYAQGFAAEMTSWTPTTTATIFSEAYATDNIDPSLYGYTNTDTRSNSNLNINANTSTQAIANMNGNIYDFDTSFDSYPNTHATPESDLFDVLSHASFSQGMSPVGPAGEEEWRAH
ncbi:hypothetical protein VTL71DRAFT_6349 [Oculimacula yallundae]|uniref:C2H2-type domain-containing protein n=1 Tax=Oculimacula yallundae TaxID=86028 RepID=A0ABR4BWR1_9HELO